MTRISNADVANVLRSLIEDNGDGHSCLETIEPYINANRESELDDAGIMALLSQVRAMCLVSSYDYSAEENRYDPTGEAPIDGQTWFRATQQGTNEYNTRYSAIAGS